MHKSFDTEVFVPIFKVDANRREVHGLMAEEKRDKSGEIFDYASSKPYVEAWSNEAVKSTLGAGQELSFGNVRAQHGKTAAGKLTSITFDDGAKSIHVIAKIVDDAEWEKVLEGVYTGFSIGGDYVKRWPDANGVRYTARPREVSIVDNPCMQGATFSMVKLNGAVEQKSFGVQQGPREAMSDIRRMLAELTKQVEDMLKRRAASRGQFVPSGVEKASDPNELLKTALANGKPITAGGGEEFDTSRPKFQTVESVGSCQRLRAGKPINAEKTDAADEELSKTLKRPLSFQPR